MENGAGGGGTDFAPTRQAAWAAYANRALEAADRPEHIDHRSYARQGIEKIPSIHMGPAASQMERRRIAALDERLEMWEQYQKYKPDRQKLDKVAPAKREQFEQRHSAEWVLFDAAVRYLDTLKTSGEAITPKAWRAEAVRLTAEKDADYLKMCDMRDEIKAVENLRKAADRLAHEGQHQRKE